MFMISALEFADGIQDLAHLINLRHASRILQIDARIPMPWRFEDGVTARPTRRTKVGFAEKHQLDKSHIGGFASYLGEKFG